MPQQRDRSDSMYVALNRTITAGGQPSWPEFVELAARVGYRGLDVDLGPAMQAGADATREMLESRNLRPAVVALPVNFREDDAAFEQGMEGLPDAAAFAAAIDCPRMGTYILPSSETPADELRRTYRERFTRIADVLARQHVRLALEFISPLHLRRLHPHEFIWRMSDMLEFADECGPNVGIMLDSWHWHHAEPSLEEIVAAGRAGKIVHVQINDSADLPPEEVNDGERLLPGEGVIDLVGFFRALSDGGYNEGLSLEVFGRGLRDIAPEEAARLALERSNAVLRDAGVPEGE